MRLQQFADFLNRTLVQTETRAMGELKQLNNLLMVIIVQLSLMLIEGWNLLDILTQ